MWSSATQLKYNFLCAQMEGQGHIIVEMGAGGKPMDCKEMALSENTYNYITDYPVSTIPSIDCTFCYADVDGMYNIVYLKRAGIPNLDTAFYEYQSIPKLYGLMQIEDAVAGYDPISFIASGIPQIQRPPLSLTGKGTVICVIDTGIDYTQAVFRDENGNSRILAIWDQTIQDGPPPEGFLFGTQYTGEDINRALQAEDPYSVVPSRDEIGHGTAIASVAAGSSVGGFGVENANLGSANTGQSRIYEGVAPDAELVLVKLKQCKQYLRDYYLLPEEVPAYQEDDIMLAVQYADSFVQLFRRPVIICLGLGTNSGDHAGGAALSRYLNMVATKRSRAVVVCGGNEGNAEHHYAGALQNGGGRNTQDVEIRVGDDSRGFILETWGNLPDIINVTVRSPGGETIPPVRLTTRQRITYGFVYERSRISIQSTLVEPSSGEQLILFRLEDPTPGIWTFSVSAEGEVRNGTFNMWLPITDFLDTEVYFLTPNPYITLTEPAMASSVISVSTYNAENNSFYIESGRGFSRVGTVRPDFAAPGVNVPTILGAYTGSSMAAAITTGAVAQLMQWAVVEQNNQFVESREIKNYLIRGASRDSGVNYPSRRWGYGRLNIAGVFETIARV